jgi:hypothetical protein
MINQESSRMHLIAITIRISTNTPQLNPLPIPSRVQLTTEEYLHSLKLSDTQTSLHLMSNTIKH